MPRCLDEISRRPTIWCRAGVPKKLAIDRDGEHLRKMMPCRSCDTVVEPRIPASFAGFLAPRRHALRPTRSDAGGNIMRKLAQSIVIIAVLGVSARLTIAQHHGGGHHSQQTYHHSNPHISSGHSSGHGGGHSSGHGASVNVHTPAFLPHIRVNVGHHQPAHTHAVYSHGYSGHNTGHNTGHSSGHNTGHNTGHTSHQSVHASAHQSFHP